MTFNLTKPTRKAPLIYLLNKESPINILTDSLAIDPRGTGHGLNNEKEAFLSKGQRSGETCNGRIKRMNKLWRKHIMLTQVTIALVVAQDTN